jgi:hypothetical protein
MTIRIIPSSKKDLKRVNEDGETYSTSTSQFLEIIKLDMQVSKRCQQENMEHSLIQVEERLIQAGEDQEEWCTQHIRAEESNALFG